MYNIKMKGECHMEYTALLNEVISLVKKASAIMLRHDFEITEKGNVVNIVTSADIAVQSFLEKELPVLLPGSAFVGEEGNEEAQKAEYLWIVDPIDGTMNFARDLGQSGISVALAHNGKVVLGVVYNPFKDELFYATAGQGAYCNGEPIKATRRPFSEGLFCTAWSLYNKALAPKCTAVMEEVYGLCNDFRRFGVCSLELCYLAQGKCDLYFEIRLFPWDYAAAGMILQEAGGIITGLDGNPAALDRTCPIIAANSPENHEKLLKIVQKHFPKVPYEEILY